MFAQTTTKSTILIVLLLALSWLGPLDTLAKYVNGNSIQDAAIIYGVARSINAVISLFQSAELGAFIGSFHPGELLDPINDLIERFSSVMAWSLSSLVLQKILLQIFSSFTFKFLFTLVCSAAILATTNILPSRVNRSVLVVFVFIAALRFSIGVVCALTAMIDYGFIQSIEQNSLKTVQAFNSDISIGLTAVTAMSEEESAEIQNLEAINAQLVTELEQTRTEIDTLRAELEQEPKINVWKRAIGRNDTRKRQLLERSLETAEQKSKRLEAQHAALVPEIECAKQKAQGQDCSSTWDKFKSLFSTEKLNEISAKVEKTVNDLLTVLVSLLLTTIVLPLIFLYVAVKGLKTGLSAVFKSSD